MADELFNGPLTLDHDWGNVDGKKASGKAVQDFIKTTLINSRVGYFHNETTNTANILRGFANEATFRQWNDAADKQADGIKELVLTETTQAKAQPQEYYAVSLKSMESAQDIVSVDGTVKLKVLFNAIDYKKPSEDSYELIPERQSTTGTLEVNYWDNNRGWQELKLSEYQISNSIKSAMTDSDIHEIDLTNALNNGTTVIQMRVIDSRINESTGRPYTTGYVQFNITKTILRLKFANVWYNPIDIINASNIEKAVKLEYFVSADVDKLLTVKITGAGGTTERIVTARLPKNENYYESVGSPYDKIKLKDSDTEPYKIFANGIHNIEAYVSALVNDVEISRTEPIYSQLLVKSDKDDTKTYVILNNINKNVINWTENSLFEYAIYGQNKANVNIKLVDRNNPTNIYLDVIEECIEGESKNFTRMLELDTTESEFYADLVISIDDKILYTDVIGIDNSGGFAPTTGASFIFNPKLYENNTFGGIKNESTKYIINEVDKSQVNVTMSGFNFTNDGFISDGAGNRCLRVVGGQTMNIQYKPFENCRASNVIEFTYSIKNRLDDDKPLITIRNSNNNWDGFELYPYLGIFKTSSKRDDLAQDVWLATDSIINVAICIYSSVNNKNAKAANLVYIYINGIANRVFELDASDIDNNNLWNRMKDITIQIGNRDSSTDIDIYGIRVYKDRTPQIKSEHILQNYIASLTSLEDKIRIKDNNAIIDEKINPTNEDIFAGLTSQISYSLCQEKKYNTLLWKPVSDDRNVKYGENTNVVGLAHGDDGDSKKYGDLEIYTYKVNNNGERILDLLRSGTIKNLRVKGQGTSSMNYWKWNQRWEFNKTKVKSGVITSDMTEDEIDKEFDTDDDGNYVLRSKFHPLQLENAYSSGLSDEQKQQIENQYGVDAYQLKEGIPFAKRLDAKINWASPMQSHKCGSVNLYNDVWKRVIRNSELTNVGATSKGKSFTNTSGGYSDCCVSISQEPFLLFVQHNTGGEIKFYGLVTMGPSKGDKPTFGYNKKDFPDFVMMEGCDNGAAIVNCEIPWNEVDIYLGDEGATYTSQAISATGSLVDSFGWEISMGDDKVNRINLSNPEANPVILKFKEMINFCYNCRINMEGFNGTFEKFIECYNNDSDVTNLVTNNSNINVANFYWMNASSSDDEHKRFNLYRFDDRSKEWVHAGVEYQDSCFGADGQFINSHKYKSYKPYNLQTNTPEITSWSNMWSMNQINDIVKQARLNRYKGTLDKSTEIRLVSEESGLKIYGAQGGIGEYVVREDLMYSLQMLKLIAASDNWAKNTYIYNPGIYKEDPNGDIVKVAPNPSKPDSYIYRMANADELSNPDIQKYKLTSKFRFFQDDLDTIFTLDNTGKKVKQYYVDENDKDGNLSPYWNASENPLFRLAYKVWDDLPNYDEQNNPEVGYMRTMMKAVLTGMGELSNTSGDKVLSCWDKYYGEITKYIPARAYNDIVDMLYIHAEKNRDTLMEGSTLDINPYKAISAYPQAVGDQYVAEKEWFRKRSILFSSYAEYGNFSGGDGSGGGGSLIFRSYSLPVTNKNGTIENKKPTYEFTIIPDQYIWPVGMAGQGTVKPKDQRRYAPNEEVNITISGVDGNTNVGIAGIDYYRSISDIGGWRVEPVEFNFSGAKISEFYATSNAVVDAYKDYNGVKNKLIFAPSSLSFGNSMKILKKIVITGPAYTNKIGGGIDISANDKVEYVDVTGTAITAITFPSQNNINHLALPDSVNTLKLTGMKKLVNDKLFVNANNITDFEFGDCPLFNEFTFIKTNFIDTNSQVLTNMVLNNINWGSNVGKTVSLNDLKYVVDKSSFISGVIDLGNMPIDFDTKMLCLSKYNNIDDETNILHIKYKMIEANSDGVRVTGASNVYLQGDYKYSIYYPSIIPGETANDFNDIRWSVDDETIASIDDLGLLTFTPKANNMPKTLTVTCEIYRQNKKTITVNKIIELKQPLGRVGDYLYMDGTYGDPSENPGDKTIVGVCIYADDTATDPTKQHRIAVATDMIISSPSDKKNKANLPIWGRYSNSVYADSINSSIGTTTTKIMTDKNIEYTGLVPMGGTSTKNGGILISASNSSYAQSDVINNIIFKQYSYRSGDYDNASAVLDFGFVDDGLGGEIPMGKYRTNCMLAAADNIRSRYTRLNLKNFNNWMADDTESYKADSKFEFINNVISNGKNNVLSGINVSDLRSYYASYYYPAASYCNAYEPTHLLKPYEELGNALKAGNWFLPSAGELATAFIYAWKSNSNAFEGNNKFAVGYNESFNLLNNLIVNKTLGNDCCITPSPTTQNTCWSSTEYYDSAKHTAYAIGAFNKVSSDESVGELRVLSQKDSSHTYKFDGGEKSYCYNLWPMICF